MGLGELYFERCDEERKKFSYGGMEGRMSDEWSAEDLIDQNQSCKIDRQFFRVLYDYMIHCVNSMFAKVMLPMVTRKLEKQNPKIEFSSISLYFATFYCPSAIHCLDWFQPPNSTQQLDACNAQMQIRQSNVLSDFMFSKFSQVVSVKNCRIRQASPSYDKTYSTASS